MVGLRQRIFNSQLYYLKLRGELYYKGFKGVGQYNDMGNK